VKKMEWFKFYGRKWLMGTIRRDMNREQMSVFADLMSMCSLCKEFDKGIISRGDGIPFERQYIADFIEAPLELLNDTLNICVETGRIIIEPTGIIHIIKWEMFQAVPDDKKRRRKPSQDGDNHNRQGSPISPATPLVVQSRLDKNAVEIAKTNRPKVIESLTEDGYKVITPDGEVLIRKEVENE
jgi:hypothetical protein